MLRIVGGHNSSYAKYPYVARLETKRIVGAYVYQSHVCTCSVLTPIWTLSASHCAIIMERKANITLMISYGSTFKIKSSDVLQLIRHPSYKQLGDPKKVYSLENDIALLKTEPVILPEYGRVSSVDYMSLVGFTAIALGFGLTNYTTKSNQMGFSTTLRLKMPLQALNVLIKRCANDVLDLVKIYPGICLARKCGETVSICSGDSGGPLIHKSRIIGVSSLASLQDCSNAVEDRFKQNVVGIITAVSPFSEWIGKVINE